jgi:hypothetical protein
VGAGLDNIPPIEKDGRLSSTGYTINILIVLSCAGTLLYPSLYNRGMLDFTCLFRSITGLPCPTCGYTSAMVDLMKGNLLHSFLHNPGWFFWLALQFFLIYIGIRSVLSGRQHLLPGRFVLPILIIILGIWVVKFMLGPDYY